MVYFHHSFHFHIASSMKPNWKLDHHKHPIFGLSAFLSVVRQIQAMFMLVAFDFLATSSYSIGLRVMNWLSVNKIFTDTQWAEVERNKERFEGRKKKWCLATCSYHWHGFYCEYHLIDSLLIAEPSFTLQNSSFDPECQLTVTVMLL